MRTRDIALSALAAVLAAGCSGSNDPDSTKPDAVHHNKAAEGIKRPAIQTQAYLSPCEWVPKEQVAEVLGALAGEPELGRSAESPRPDDEGHACVYPFTGRNGQASRLAIEVDPSGSAEFEQAMGMMGAMFARELNDGKPVKSGAPEKRTDGWDAVNALPTMSVWRVGHIAVQVGGDTFFIPREKIGQIAALVRDRVKDVPFAAPGADPNGAGPAPDPCSLLSRAEVETVIGPLTVEPFRSAENSALADGSGATCAYYTAGHRALLVTPTWSDAQQTFDMVGGVSGVIRKQVGGADNAEALDGPWDQSSTSAARGTAYFLKDDKMVEIEFRTSATDLAGAAKLARLAVTRL
jgi:hypothetical protein